MTSQTTCSCKLYSWSGGPTPGKCLMYGCDPAKGVFWAQRHAFPFKAIPDYSSYLGRGFLRDELDNGNTDLPWGIIVKQLLDEMDLDWAKSRGIEGEALERWMKHRGIYEYSDDLKPKRKKYKLVEVENE